METTPAKPEQPRADVDAAAMLEGLLRLIEGSKDTNDFTRQRLEAELGMPIDATDDVNWGGSQRLTSEWRVNVLVSPHPLSEQRTLVLDFGPEPSESSPPMTGICGMDVNQFGQRLVKQGMTHETMQGEHGMVWSERYTRPGLEVDVTPQPEADEPDDVRTHQCVKMVHIHKSAH